MRTESETTTAGGSTVPRPPIGRRLLRRLPEVLLTTGAAVLLVWMVPTMILHASVVPKEQACRANLRVIYKAIQRYRADHGGDYPPELVAVRPPRLGEAPLPVLAPRYLSDLSKLICPEDVSGGKKGWTLPCSYEYELQELDSTCPEVRERVRTQLIDAYGQRLRLVVCPEVHRPWHGFLTLSADGTIKKEMLTRSDAQKKLRESFWKLEEKLSTRPAAVHPAGEGQSVSGSRQDAADRPARSR